MLREIGYQNDRIAQDFTLRHAALRPRSQSLRQYNNYKHIYFPKSGDQVFSRLKTEDLYQRHRWYKCHLHKTHIANRNNENAVTQGGI